jgi:hypothetical protein
VTQPYDPNQAQGYPQQAPPQQPGWPPAPPQQPGPYPQQPGPYPQQVQQPGPYPQQQAPQAPPAAPAGPKTGVGDFLDQPAQSGGALSFDVPGTRHTVVVARDLDDPDFPQQTDANGQLKYYSDSRPMVVMVVPVLVQPDAAHPDGHASWWVKGQAAEALKQAMAAVGAGDRKGIPENGAMIDILFTGTKPPKRGGFNPTKIYQVTYKRPDGAANGQPAPQQAQQAPGPVAQIPAQVAQQFAGVQGAVQPAPQFQGAQQYGQPPGPPLSQEQWAAIAAQQPPAPVPSEVAALQADLRQSGGLPQQPGMAAPGQQVAYAAQQGVQAAQQAPPGIAPPAMDPETHAKLQLLLGQQGQAPQQ